jgi:hypothetical protein
MNWQLLARCRVEPPNHPQNLGGCIGYGLMLGLDGVVSDEGLVHARDEACRGIQEPLRMSLAGTDAGVHHGQRSSQSDDDDLGAGDGVGDPAQLAARFEDSAEDEPAGSGIAEVRPDARQIAVRHLLVPRIVGRPRPGVGDPGKVDQSMRHRRCPQETRGVLTRRRLADTHRPCDDDNRYPKGSRHDHPTRLLALPPNASARRLSAPRSGQIPRVSA